MLIYNSCASPQDLKTVESVDLTRYMGVWYDVASYPTRFQKNCYNTVAEYTMVDGYVKVRNSCRKDSFNAELSSIEGKAFVVKGSGNSKLKVQFFWPFKGDYWIIDLDEINYRYAVVGHPSREYLWILSREKVIDPILLEGIKQRLRDQAYDVEKLRMTPQR